MTLIDSTYQGQLRCQSSHGPSGTLLETDAPTDNQGKGERFSPTDLVATALSTCMLTIMGIVAERHGWSLEGVTARVEKTMSSDAPRRIAAHRLLHPGRDTLQAPTVPLGHDAHDREHAGAQGCGHQVGGGEALALALVVGGGVGLQEGAGGPMAGLATQLPLVGAVDQGHVGSWCGWGRQLQS